MKGFVILSLLVISSFARSATVKITSFNFVRLGDNSFGRPLAELCGKVENSVKAPSFINVLVDFGSQRPGSYNTISDANGKFCLPVITYRGSAEVSIIGDTKKVKASVK